MERSPARGYEAGGVRTGLGHVNCERTRTVLPPQKAAVRNPVLRSSEARHQPQPSPQPTFYPNSPALGPLKGHRPEAWVWLFGALITAAFFGSLVFRARGSVPHIHRPVPSEVRPDVPPEKVGGEVEGWSRLNEALARVPPEQVGAILHDANQWLEARGSANCSVRAAKGQISLVLGAGHVAPRPLQAALARCAEAVEHVMR